MEITETEVTLHPDDGYPIVARRFEPAGRARGSVVIHGATATPRRYYDRFARYLAGEGLRVLAYDYRGVGASRPVSLRGFEGTMRDWAERDAVAAVRHLRECDPDAKLVMVGHSFGGQLLGLSDALREVDAAVMVGVQFGYEGNWPLLGRAWMGALWRGVFPAALAVFGYVPGWAGMGEDLPAGVAREWSGWCMSPGYLTDAVPEALGRFAALRAPVLFYSFTDDRYAPGRAVRQYLATLTRARVTHRRLRPEDLNHTAVGHFGFFRPQHRDTLWTEALGFIDDALAGRRSELPSVSPPGWIEAPDETELLADLAYGRE
ncbi:MAG: alpha/beta fold hydrolase [Polyangiales bacterium]